MITVWFGGGQAGGCFASGMGPPWGLSSRSGIPWGRPWVLRGPQGSARRAERSEPLWFPGVLGQALLPGVRRRSGWVADRMSRPLAVVTILGLLSRFARAGVATVGWGCLAGEDGPP